MQLAWITSPGLQSDHTHHSKQHPSKLLLFSTPLPFLWLTPSNSILPKAISSLLLGAWKQCDTTLAIPLVQVLNWLVNNFMLLLTCFIDHCWIAESALHIACEEAPLSFPIGLVLDDQLFGLGILASHCLEQWREYLTKADHQVLFNILNRGLWDQDVMDASTDVATWAICYSAVMGEQLWRVINGNVLQVGDGVSICGNSLTLLFRTWIWRMSSKHWRPNLQSIKFSRLLTLRSRLTL